MLKFGDKINLPDVINTSKKPTIILNSNNNVYINTI